MARTDGPCGEERPVTEREDEVQHGIAGGAYDNLGRVAFGHPCPYLDCLCGWSSPSGAAESWEEAGAMLDAHLAEVLDG